MKLQITENMCAITKRVVKDFNTLSDAAFMHKYSCTKARYFKRVMKYGDPYMNAPLAKIGKFLAKFMKQ